ncbi:MAG: 50S ribosomal protein L20 [Candidatus Omnitrophica bacterium]|nr:50S ribosomal protein L20 [Candidatus Omnitrophota bacterium]
MPRVRHAPATQRRKKRVLKRAKGMRGGRSRLYRTAVETVKRAMAYAYRDRKARKREFRSLWIVRINAAAEKQGLSYAKFMAGLKKAKIVLDRKILADLAVNDEPAFGELVRLAKGE